MLKLKYSEQDTKQFHLMCKKDPFLVVQTTVIMYVLEKEGRS